jgi:hypothetical protein
MVANLCSAPIRCIINGVDYSAQVLTANFGYEKLGADVAGGVCPFSGDIQLGLAGDHHPINNRLDPSLFAFDTDLAFSIQLSGTWYPLPPMSIELANYTSATARTTLKVGDALYMASKTPQAVDSSVLDITIGSQRTSSYAISRLLAQIGGIAGITREANSYITFRYPRNLGTNYVSAVGSLCASEGTIAYVAPSGRVIIRETWTVANPNFPGQYPLPVLGTYRTGERKTSADTVALERELAECSELAMPGSIGTKYSTSGSFYEVFPTPTTETSSSPDGNTTTTTTHNFTAATARVVTKIREPGSNVYAGIAGQASGEIESEEHTELEQYDRNEPGRLLSKTSTERIRVAKISKSRAGWIAQNGGEGDINEDGEVTAAPYPGANWSSMLTAKEITETWDYLSDKPTIPEVKTVVTKMAVVSIFDGLTNGVDWSLIIDNSPYTMGTLRTAITEETRWVEKGKGSWEIYISTTTVKALQDTGERSAIIGGLQKAAELEDGNMAGYWLTQALKTVRTVQRIPASPNNSPPAFKPKPRRYYGVGANVEREVTYRYPSGSTRDVYKSVSIPFVSDENGAAFGNSAAAQDATNILNKVAMLDRMNAQSYQVMMPLYPEILTGLSPYAAVDVFVEQDSALYRLITTGLSISLNEQEAAIHFVGPTLARVVGNTFIHPYQQV